MSNAKAAGISIVIPVYNGERTIAELIRRLGFIFTTLSCDFEAILVNDGSSDNSWSAICDLARQHDWILGINLTRNFGQHNALLCGIREARHGTIVTMDDDLQHPPEAIPSLLDKLDEGYDVVYGSPQEEMHGFLRNVASVVIKRVFQNVMGVEIGRMISAYRAFRTELRAAFSDFREPFVSIDVLLSWATTRFAVVKIKHEERSQGESNYSLSRLASHTYNMLTGFTVAPLRLASLIGFLFTLLGIGILAYVLFIYFTVGTSVSGFPFLASIIAIFSGAQLFSLGIIGEYVARVYFNSMNKPAYVIKEKVVHN
jgi:undecaprenyl-phosphate 4-deoxy-4-formamido-L-arabinose transferase